MRLQSGALSFSFDGGRELERFHIYAVVCAAAWLWCCDLRSRGGAGFGGPLAAKQDCALRRCSILLFFGGSRSLCAVGWQRGERWRRVGRCTGGPESGRRVDPHFLKVVRKRIR